MDYTTILYAVDDGVAFITLNRPEAANAVNNRMKRELDHAWRRANADPQVVVAVLTGAGDKAFCSGMDLKEAAKEGFEGNMSRWVTPIDCGMQKPVVCAVNGVCAGGALAFVADSDITLAAEHAIFVDARVSVGVTSILGTVRLARKMPIENVFRLALLGIHGRLTAQQAKEAGLVGQVVAKAELLGAATDLARAMARNSSEALIVTKRVLWNSLNMGMDAAMGYAWEALHAFEGHPDMIEGPRAFAEGRKPQWARPKPRSGAFPES
jgi:E-phenylitaconyl-CoA hydratase